MLDLVFNNFTADPSPGSDFFKRIITEIFKELRVRTKTIEVSVNLVGVSRMRALNKQYRGKNRATDVLAFESGARFAAGEQFAKQRRKSFVFAQSDVLRLGDIVICPRFVKNEAKANATMIEAELAVLTIHGILHLLGYDHEKSTIGQKRMFKIQKMILERLHFIRSNKN